MAESPFQAMGIPNPEDAMRGPEALPALEAGRSHPFSSQWNPTRHAIEAPFRAIQHAGFYPLRVIERYMAQSGMTRPDGSSWSAPSGGLMERAQLPGMIEALRGVPYTPGQRESTNIDDQRATSIWSY